MKNKDSETAILRYVFYALLVCVMISCYTKPQVKKLMTESHQAGWVDGATRVYNVTVLDSIYDSKHYYKADSVEFIKILNAL